MRPKRVPGVTADVIGSPAEQSRDPSPNIAELGGARQQGLWAVRPPRLGRPGPSRRAPSRTSPVAQPLAQRAARAHQAPVHVREPRGAGEQQQQQQQLHLLADLLHREPRHRDATLRGVAAAPRPRLPRPTSPGPPCCAQRLQPRMALCPLPGLRDSVATPGLLGPRSGWAVGAALRGAPPPAPPGCLSSSGRRGTEQHPRCGATHRETGPAAAWLEPIGRGQPAHNQSVMLGGGAAR